MNSLRIERGCQAGGVVLILAALLLLGYMLTMPSSDWRRSSRLGCINNLKQIGLAFRTWAIDNDGQFPFNVSTNAGGTMELCSAGRDGVDKNGFLHLLVMSNELCTPKLLVCPADDPKSPALDWQTFRAANLTYQIHVGTNICDANPTEVLAVCPIHGNILHCDGSVEQKGRSRR
jgi:hypothetical protein